MSRDKQQLLSPLFLKYQSEYERNPRSRVFAPLAEAYRKFGMTDKAMDILSQGIRLHPSYVMGYLGMAFCYFDLKQFNLAYTTLRPLVEGNRDNIRLQKLFADICLELGHKEEALETYKYLLFINPRDKEIAAQVTMLENFIESQYKPVHKPIVIAEEELSSNRIENRVESQRFEVEKLQVKPASDPTDFDDWLALDLSKDKAKSEKESDPYEQWNLKKAEPVLQITKPIIESPVNSEAERKFEVKLDFEEPEHFEDLITEPAKVEVPLVTHTLVDLYCGQGHIEKALEVLEKILALNPTDKKTIDKIAEIKSLMGIEKQVEEQFAESSSHEERATEDVEEEKPHHSKMLIPLEENTVSEEDGRKHLMSILDETLGEEEVVIIEEPKVFETKPSKQDRNREKIEEKLNLFLQRIQKRALDYQSRL